MARGATLPPVQLVQLGELFFVVDGHHRVSVARARGRVSIAAQVKRVCTVAYACACLTVLDLPSKAAERDFLERYPLPDDVRPWLWLDDPDDRQRLRAAAQAWIHGDPAPPADAAALDDVVAAWWADEVVPTAARCHGRDRPDLQDYLCAVSVRDDAGCCVPEAAVLGALRGYVRCVATCAAAGCGGRADGASSRRGRRGSAARWVWSSPARRGQSRPRATDRGS